MNEELSMIEKNETQRLVDRPHDRKVIQVKWIYKLKTNPDGSHPPCGRSDTSKGGYPKCRKVRVAARMTKKQKRASVARKRSAERKGSKGSGRKPNYAK